MIKIVNKNKYLDLIKKQEQLQSCNINLAKDNGEKQKALNAANEKIQRMEIDNAALKDIQLIDENNIKDLENKIMEKNQLIENLIKEKETKSIIIADKDKKIDQLKSSNNNLKGAKGGLVAKNNNLRDKLDAKERVIEEYKKAIEELEKKNEIQAEKIKELSKKVKHEIIEYENDGLPKTTKESLKSKRKIRRK